MNQYHKIQTVFLRDPGTKFKTLLEGEWAEPEFGALQHAQWLWDEKLDGTNIRVMWDGERLEFRGKSDNSQIPPQLLGYLQKTFRAEMFLDRPHPMCLYGEGVGPKIQKVGSMYGDEQHFVLFDVRVGDWWLLPNAVFDVASEFYIPQAPQIGIGTLPEMVEFVKSGPPSVYGDGPAEGVVARPQVPMRGRDGHRIITKLKVKDFA